MTNDQKADVFGSGFFSTPWEWSRPSAVASKGAQALRKAVLAATVAATLTAATATFAGDAATSVPLAPAAGAYDSVAFLVSPKAIFGFDVKASPDAYLASIVAGHKALRSATQLIEAGAAAGVPPSRVVGIERGGVAVYWFSKQKLAGGASARFALFESEKDGTYLTLSDHTPAGVQVFEVKHANREEMVARALSYTA